MPDLGGNGMDHDMFSGWPMRNCSGRGNTKKPRNKESGLFVGGFALLAQLKFLDYRLVAVGGRPLEVVEKAPPGGDEFEKAAAGRVVLCVGFEMLGELIDALGKKRDLNVGTTGVFFVKPDCVDFDFCCCLGHCLVSFRFLKEGEDLTGLAV